MSGDANKAGPNSALVEYALRGLERCWLPEYERWSHVYHLDRRSPPNQSIAHSDVFYTLNVLLGFSKVSNVPSGLNLANVFYRNVSQLRTLPVPKYAFGVALWASAALGLELPPPIMEHITTIILDKTQWGTFSAQDLGMILTGVVAQANNDARKWSGLADDLFSFLSAHFCSSSHLFFNSSRGLRRRFSSFATNTYLTIASYAYGDFAGHEGAITLGNNCTRKLLSLQGPNGEWPWFFDAKRGIVLDFYEVYTVHQTGMAPAFLELAERHGMPEARGALVRGFLWTLGNNQLKTNMLVPELNLTIRSQARRGELQSRGIRAFRASLNALAGRPSGLIAPGRVRLRLECRSYELGWILWSFGNRNDLVDLTDNRLFKDANKAP